MLPLSAADGELNSACPETVGLYGLCVVSVRERWCKTELFQPAVVEEPEFVQTGGKRDLYWIAGDKCKLPSVQEVTNLFLIVPTRHA